MPRWTEDRDLTQRQKEVLKVVRAYAKKHGYPPNYTELGRLLSIRQSAAYCHVQRLAKRGCLEVTVRTPNRSIHLPETAV